MINDKCIIYHNIQWSLGAFVSNQCNGLRITWLGRWVLDFLRMDIPSKPRVTSKEMGCTSKSASISPPSTAFGQSWWRFSFFKVPMKANLPGIRISPLRLNSEPTWESGNGYISWKYVTATDRRYIYVLPAPKHVHMKCVVLDNTKQH